MVFAEAPYRWRMCAARRSNSAFHMIHNSILPGIAREQPRAGPFIRRQPAQKNATLKYRAVLPRAAAAYSGTKRLIQFAPCAKKSLNVAPQR